MLENLQGNIGQELEESVVGFRLKGKNKSRQNNGRFTLMDLITIFTDEANKICKNKDVANLIALESLRDYIRKNVSNIKIVL